MTKNEIEQAVPILRAGGLVAFPTETVYGLGADATNAAAIEKVFLCKKRPHNHPLIVHLADYSQLLSWALEVPPGAMNLARAFWPGPLTLVLRKRPEVHKSVTGGQETVGVRVPNHPIAHALLKAFGGGLVAPSANLFTHISPTTAAAVKEELGEQVNLILDGGACEVGLESTIVDFSRKHPVILRPGMISALELEFVLGHPIGTEQSEGALVRAPGMHHVHYAPLTSTILVSSQALAQHVEMTRFTIAVVLHSAVALPSRDNIEVIHLSNQPKQYAHDLYHTLRELDHQGFQQIVIEEVPNEAGWDAIRDRLHRAARR